jgi:thiamine transport system substrate-binding protein
LVGWAQVAVLGLTTSSTNAAVAFGGRVLKNRFVWIAVIFTIVVFGLLLWTLKISRTSRTSLKIMTYSSFMSSWGPGPSIAKLFEAQGHLHIDYIDASDAGLILQKLKLQKADLVVGLNQLNFSEALRTLKWRRYEGPKDGSRGGPTAQTDRTGLVQYDWAPLTFIYRKGEIEPPHSLNDLLDSRFRGKITLPDPRTSGPGLQFLLWVLGEMGEEKGFDFLAQLKPNIFAVAPSWSMSYGLFQKKQAALTFSYATSPFYHWQEEKDFSYQAAELKEKEPEQIEYAGVLDDCDRCQEAADFVAFLRTPEVQRILVLKNYMLPVLSSVRSAPPLDLLNSLPMQPVSLIWQDGRFTDSIGLQQEALLQKRTKLFERWQNLGL